MPQKNLYIWLTFVCASFSLFAQSDVCPEVTINDGNPIFINCNSETNCVNLTANYPKIALTNNYTVSSINYSPQFPFSGLSHPISVDIDDVWSDPKVLLPFEFSFYGQNYSEVTISSNGALSFNTNATNNNGSNYASFSAPENEDFCPWKFNLGIPNSQFPSVGEPKKITNTIFGVFHDIDPSKGGEIGWDIFGEYPCRKLVVSYSKVPLFECESVTSTFQIVLYESTNAIEVNIEQKSSCSNWNDGNSLIGLQNDDATFGITPPNRNTGNWATDHESWLFMPSGSFNQTVTWYDVTNANQIIGNVDSLTVCPNEENTYSVEVEYVLPNGSTIVVEDSTTITFNNEIISENPMQITLCDDDGVQDGFIEINLRDTEDDIEMEFNNDAAAPVTYHLNLQEAKDNINAISMAYAFQNIENPQKIFGRIEDVNSGCVLIKPIVYKVTIEPIMATAAVVTEKFENQQQIIATVEGDANYVFSIDDNEFQESPIFNDVEPGVHFVTIADENHCFEKNIRLVVLDYPKFFTPNGDGFNDTWNIKNKQELASATIYIFDRYGKPLYEIPYDNSEGWNGLYDNNQLPASDYWFKIVYTEEPKGVVKEKMGHFTLKR